AGPIQCEYTGVDADSSQQEWTVMMKKWSGIFLTGVLALSPQLAHAEADAPEHAGGTAATSLQRPTDDTLMKEEYARLLGGLFSQPWKSLYNEFRQEKPTECGAKRVCLNSALVKVKT